MADTQTMEETVTDNTIIETVPAEADNLALHVQLCEQRYLQLLTKFDSVDARFERLETMLLEIKESINNSQIEVYKKYLSWAGIIITALLGIVAHNIIK